MTEKYTEEEAQLFDNLAKLLANLNRIDRRVTSINYSVQALHREASVSPKAVAEMETAACNLLHLATETLGEVTKLGTAARLISADGVKTAKTINYVNLARVAKHLE